MRLLEFENEKDGANPNAIIMPRPADKPSPAKTPTPPSPLGAPAADKAFPGTDEHTLHKPVRRKPIDLEQLQQRVEVLERRIRERARKQGTQVPTQELEQLKQRLKQLERSVHTELWSAKQREHTLLEMLARPPLKLLILEKARKFRNHTLPATRRMLREAYHEWWRLYQPAWWPAFARAWQESLDKARGIDKS